MIYEWKNVENEPEDYGWYIIADRYEVRQAYFGHPCGESHTGWYNGEDWESTIEYEVTHWTEFPEHPKKIKERKKEFFKLWNQFLEKD